MMDLGIKKDFPLLQEHADLAFLDNAATTQKPGVVIDAEADLYRHSYANIHRAIYDLATTATEAFEGARTRAATFINAPSANEIVFTPNASAALNLAAYIEGQSLKEGDEVIVSIAGHHSNILPWMRLAKTKGVILKWIELTSEYRLDLEDLQKKITDRTKVVAFAQVSNVLGDVADVKKIVSWAHAVGAHVIVDAAQSSCRMPIDVQDLGADYMAFSAHKMYGPTGVGWLYGKAELLDTAEPMIAGGGTIKTVSREAIEWADVPWRYEAGTPDIAGVAALNSLFDYLEKVGMQSVWQHDQEISKYLLEKLTAVPGLKLYGPATTKDRAAVYSFSLSVNDKTVHPHDVADICNQYKVAIRGGHHCAQPLMKTLDVETLNRVSAGMYTATSDIDQLIGALQSVSKTFS